MQRDLALFHGGDLRGLTEVNWTISTAIGRERLVDSSPFEQITAGSAGQRRFSSYAYRGYYTGAGRRWMPIYGQQAGSFRALVGSAFAASVFLFDVVIVMPVTPAGSGYAGVSSSARSIYPARNGEFSAIAGQTATRRRAKLARKLLATINFSDGAAQEKMIGRVDSYRCVATVRDLTVNPVAGSFLPDIKRIYHAFRPTRVLCQQTRY